MSGSTNRFTHDTTVSPQNKPSWYQLGQRQAKLANERYHFLRAAITGKFALTEVPGDFSRGQLFPRAGILFDQYTAFKLEPVVGVKLHPRDDGTIHPEDLEVYVRSLRNNWKSRQGGILYCIGEAREFWNMILNYRSSAQTTGWKVWDRLFNRLKENGFDKGRVPCMVRIPQASSPIGNLHDVRQFFATEAGCLDPQCPFLHDEAACIRDREKVLSKRRWKLGKPTGRDIAARERREIRAYQSTQRQVVPVSALSRSGNDLAAYDDVLDDDDDDDDFDPGVREIMEDSRNITKICNNSNCLTVRTRRGASNTLPEPDDIKMLVCSKCKVATYCSVSLLEPMDFLELTMLY